MAKFSTEQSESPSRDESQSAPKRRGHVRATPHQTPARALMGADTCPPRIPQPVRYFGALRGTGGSTCRSPCPAPDGAGSASHHAQAKELRGRSRGRARRRRFEKRLCLDGRHASHKRTRVGRRGVWQDTRAPRRQEQPGSPPRVPLRLLVVFPSWSSLRGGSMARFGKVAGLRLQTNHLDTPPAINNGSLIDIVEPSSDVTP